MSSLPRDLLTAVDELVSASGLEGAAARELRDDLETHVRDALEAGRTTDEVRASLGLPGRVGPLLAASPPPRPRRSDAYAGEGLVRALFTDLAYAGRTLIRSPAPAASAVAVLAVGIAATAVVLTVANELLLRPLPVEDQETLVDVWADVRGGNSFAGFGWEDVRSYRDAVASGEGPLEELAAFAGTRLTLGEGSGSRPVVGQLVSQEYLTMLGVEAVAGTRRLPEEPSFGAAPVAVLSHALWSDRFGADPGLVGRTVVLDGQTTTVVGVADPAFRGHFIGFPVDLWLPLTNADDFLPGFDATDRAAMPFELIGRLRPGATAEAARAALSQVAMQLTREHPETHRGHGVGVTPTTGLDHSLRGAATTFVAALTVLGLLVLVIACLNVGGILLVRTLSRGREMAVRLALGAGRRRLVGLMLAESLLLAALGTGLGLLLAVWANQRLGALLRALTSGLGLELPLDGTVLTATAAAGAAAAVLAAAAPSFHLLRKAPASALRAAGGGGAGSRGRSVLVVGQVAASVALVVATGLFVRALTHGLHADPGFPADRVATLVLPAGGEMASLDALLRELAALPGVGGVALADGPPTGVVRSPIPVRLPGVEPPPGEDDWAVDGRRVGPGYLSTVGIALQVGRDLGLGDARDGGGVAVVSEAFRRRFWPDVRDVLGRTFHARGRAVQVVGIAADVRFLVQDEEPDPFVYLPLTEALPDPLHVTLRATDPAAVTAAVRDVVVRHRPDSPPPTLTPAREVLDAALFPQRLAAALVGSMGLAALLLAGTGLYGVVHYTVSRDRHELAVRLALGGSRTSILAVVLRKGLLLVGVGTALGLGVAALASPALSAFLQGVSPRDPLTYGAAVLLFAGVGLLASWLPARRAARTDPAGALRAE